MEAQLQNTAQATRPPEFYSAELRVDDASVQIRTSNLSLLTRLIERVKQPTLASAGAPFPPIAAGVSADEKAAVVASAAPAAPAETKPKAEAKKEPAAAAGKPAQPTAAPAASSPTAAAAPSPAADAPAVPYDDVKAVVTKLYALKPEAATDLVKSFGVDNAKKLPEAQWPELVAKGKDLIAQLSAS